LVKVGDESILIRSVHQDYRYKAQIDVGAFLHTDFVGGNTYRGIVQKLHLSRLKNLSQDLGMQASIDEPDMLGP